MYIVIAILVFGVLITVHEFGHFIAARLCGVRVLEFAIGMGPKLFKREGKETLFTLRALPIGGFCAMEGEDEESDDPRAFTNQRFWKKLIILVAGSAMNFLLGFLLILAIITPQNFRAPVIAEFMEGSPYIGENAFLPGDEFYKIDGERIYTATNIKFFLDRGNGVYDLEMIRNGEKITLNDFHMVPSVEVETEVDGEIITELKYGVIYPEPEAGALARLKYSWYQSIEYVRLVRISLVDLFTGAAGLRDLSGPVGIVSVMNDVAMEQESFAAGLLSILGLMAFITINLSVMNLLPIPALDGGRILFLAISWVAEKLLRRKLNPKYEGYVHAVFMVALLGLMAFVMINDVVRIVTGA